MYDKTLQTNEYIIVRQISHRQAESYKVRTRINRAAEVSAV